uniref:Uncharacterized protein n=1 Tax=Rhizophora mucronata TaxID=61149 RepID=A0A2P2PNT1_RHIMU
MESKDKKNAKTFPANFIMKGFHAISSSNTVTSKPQNAYMLNK